LGDLGFLFTFRSLFFLTLAAIRRKAANQKDLLPLKFNLPAFSLSATIDWILNYSTVNDGFAFSFSYHIHPAPSPTLAPSVCEVYKHRLLPSNHMENISSKWTIFLDF
jgi:hypothetical protein